MIIFIFLVLALIVIYYFVTSAKSSPLPKDKVKFFSGTMGSGKSYLSCATAINAYRKSLFLWKIRLLKHKPHFYSNIPVQLRKLTKIEKKHLSVLCGRKIHSVNDLAYYYEETGTSYRHLLETWGVLNEWLLKDHILWAKMLPKNTTIFIDELTLIADQYSHDIPVVREQLVFFIGFCRHWFLGKHGILTANAQATDQIVKQVRTKFGIGIVLSGFRRSLGFLPWYKVNCYETINVDDVRINGTNVTDDLKSKPYYFGKFPYFTKYYNSHCYEPAYAQKFVKEPDFLPNLQTRYLIDIQCSEDDIKAYKKNREQYHNALFESASVDVLGTRKTEN